MFTTSPFASEAKNNLSRDRNYHFPISVISIKDQRIIISSPINLVVQLVLIPVPHMEDYHGGIVQRRTLKKSMNLDLFSRQRWR
jgi:hypothetical protein